MSGRVVPVHLRKPSRVTADDARIDSAVITLFSAVADLGSQLRSLRARIADPRYLSHPKRPAAIAHATRLEEEILRLAADATDFYRAYTPKRREELLRNGFRWPPANASRQQAVAWFRDEWMDLYEIGEEQNAA